MNLDVSPVPDNTNKSYKKLEAGISSVLKKKRIIFLTLLIILITQFFIFIAGRYINRQGPPDYYQPQTDIPEKPETKCHVETEYQNQTLLNVTGEKAFQDPVEIALLNIIKTNSIQHLVDKAGEIKTYSINPLIYKVAYILETPQLGNEGNSMSAVYIHNIKDNKAEEIYKEEITPGDESGDYFFGIKDIGFSDDGKYLAITTATAIYIHDVSTGEIDEVYSTPPKEPKKMGVYSYAKPVFSDSGRYLLFGLGLYEGRTSKILDLESGKIIERSFSGYVAGESAIDWYGDRLLFQRYGEYDWVKDTGFYLAGPGDFLDEENIYPLKKESGALYPWDNPVYKNYLYLTGRDSKPSGVFACDKAGKKYEVNSTFGTLNRVDLDTGDYREILRWDTTRVAGTESPYYSLGSITPFTLSGEEVLILHFIHGNESILYTLNDTEPYSLTKLVF